MSNLMPHNRVFSEKELLSDLLMSENQVTSSYNIGITQSTCPELRKYLNKCMTNVQTSQYSIFNAMKQRGWYEIKEVDTKDIENAKNKFSKILSQLY